MFKTLKNYWNAVSRNCVLGRTWMLPLALARVDDWSRLEKILLFVSSGLVLCAEGLEYQWPWGSIGMLLEAPGLIFNDVPLNSWIACNPC